MTSQTVGAKVTFSNSFQLPGMDRLYPPGTYLVESDEETIGDGHVIGYRRTGTRIHLTSPGRVEVVPIELNDLEAALIDDATTD